MSLNCARTYHTLNSHIFDNWHIQFQILHIYSLILLPHQSWSSQIFYKNN